MKSVIKPKACKNIGEIRDALDQIDSEIIQLFSERHGFVKEIVKFKSGDDGIIATDRQEIVINQRRAWAEQMGVDPDMIEKIFRLLIEKNIQLQFDIRNKKEF